jgi:hypothetical protein
MIARKSPTYTPTSNGNSGSIVGLYSTNMGGTWNETCIWTNGTNLARYPNGGIYNPLGNTNINSAYLVGSGPITGGSGWLGNWYASKQITTPGNPTSAGGASEQALLNSTLTAATPAKPHHMSRYAFTTIDGGIARSMAVIANDGNATTNSAYGLRGAAMVKGMFTAGTFAWTTDSFIPPTTMHSNFTPSTTDDYKNLIGVPLQAWNENGTIGYVIMLGSRATATTAPTRVNAMGGYQPIVYKTTNSGTSWSLLPANDFSDANCFRGVWDRTYPISTNSAVIVPNFSGSEGFDAVVDANGQLHFGSMVYGHYYNHTDSLGYRYVFGTEQYSYGETGPFEYPVYYDFYTLPAGGWDYLMVDSMGTEGPSGTSGQPGYAANQWSDGSGAKMDQDARFQMSRSVDGTKIFYTWTEGDSTLTGDKWNAYPNIRLKGYDLNTGKMTARVELTSGDATHNGGGYYHYTSNKAASAAGCYTVPVTLTKNGTLDGSVAVDTYFNDNGVICGSQFTINKMSPKGPTGCVTGIANSTAFNYEVGAYPNPAEQSTTILVNLKEQASNINVTIMNSIGQVVKTIKSSGSIGANEFTIDLNSLSSGVYFYNVQVGNSSVTKKLIVQ